MKKLLVLITTLTIAIGAYAQIEAPVKWAYLAKRTAATEAVILLKATIQPGWHIYSQNVKSGGPIKTSFTFAPSKDYVLAGKVAEPKPVTKFEPSFKMNVTYFEKEVIFQQKIKLKTANATAVKGKIEYEVCNNLKCVLPPDVNFNIPVAK
ncbi:MAG: protein-disulfide reductase DsbD domain-containing protein [Mucilaginibacter sp.]